MATSLPVLGRLTPRHALGSDLRQTSYARSRDKQLGVWRDETLDPDVYSMPLMTRHIPPTKGSQQSLSDLLVKSGFLLLPVGILQHSRFRHPVASLPYPNRSGHSYERPLLVSLQDGMIL